MRKPASEHESLSHWQICRPVIAAGCTGTSSINGLLEITIPPGCCEMCRGRPEISLVSSAKARQRGESSRCSASGSSWSSSATLVAFQPSETREIEQHFGPAVTRLANELAHFGDIRLTPAAAAAHHLEPAQAEALRKMLLSVVSDPRLVLARLAR